MSDVTWMSHPDLPDSAPIQVVKSQVPHLAGGGWFEVDPPPKPAPRKDSTGGEPSAAPASLNDSADLDVSSGEPKSKPKPHRTPRRREEKD